MRDRSPITSLFDLPEVGIRPPRRVVAFSLRAFILVVVVSLWAAAAYADELVLKNGDHLTGEVVDLQDGNVSFKTDYAGVIKVRQERVGKITTTGPVTILLDNGESFKGPLSMRQGGRVTVGGGPDREPVVLSWDKVAAINPLPPAWHGTFTLGGSQQSGNTDRANFSIAFSGTKKTPRDRFRLGFLYNYASESGSVTTRNAYGHFQYNYFFSPTIFGYLGVELLNDHFKNINLRTVVGPGVGYQVWDEENSALEFEGGIAYFSEDVRDGEDRRWATARFAVDFRTLLLSAVVFSENLTVYPSLQKTGDYQLRNVAGLTSPLWSNWSLNLKNIFERDSNPQPGIKSNDVTWVLGMQYSF
jgi:putative salt-induced outer membrane protein YdiY